MSGTPRNDGLSDEDRRRIEDLLDRVEDSDSESVEDAEPGTLAEEGRPEAMDDGVEAGSGGRGTIDTEDVTASVDWSRKSRGKTTTQPIAIATSRETGRRAPRQSPKMTMYAVKQRKLPQTYVGSNSTITLVGSNSTI